MNPDIKVDETVTLDVEGVHVIIRNDNTCMVMADGKHAVPMLAMRKLCEAILGRIGRTPTAYYDR